MIEEVVIGVVELIDVAALDIAFVRPVAHGDALHQYIGGSAKINDQVGKRDLFGQGFVHFVIHIQLIPGQVDACEKRVFFKGVIGDQIHPPRKDLRNVGALLTVAAEQEKDLCLESVPGPV